MNKVNLASMKKRRSTYAKLNRPKFYIVTFDLKRSKGRTKVYRVFKDHLENFLGSENTHRVIKQCYFVRSRFSMSDLRSEMQLDLQRGDSILIARLQPGYSYSLKAPGAAARASEYFQQLKQEES